MEQKHIPCWVHASFWEIVILGSMRLSYTPLLKSKSKYAIYFKGDLLLRRTLLIIENDFLVFVYEHFDFY